MAGTILLDTLTWDLVLDANQNIAQAAEPYSLAQDAASAIKTFLGEVYFDTALGIDWFGQVFGRPPNPALLKARLIAAAVSMEGIASAQCFLTEFSNRAIAGQIQVTSARTGQQSVATFTVINPQGAG